MFSNILRFILLVCFLVFIPCPAQQKTDNYSYHNYLLPASLMVGGLLISPLKKDIHPYISAEKRITKIDDYAQLVPLSTVYLANLTPIKGQNSVWNQTRLLAFSYLLSSAITIGMKRTTLIERPYGGNYHSFPSGHTSFAFTGATALYLEYRNSNKWLAYSGYLFAAATGVLRIANNKHWLNDVLFGAGVGIASTVAIYHLNPFGGGQRDKEQELSHNPMPLHKNKKRIKVSFFPALSANTVGGYLGVSF